MKMALWRNVLPALTPGLCYCLKESVQISVPNKISLLIPNTHYFVLMLIGLLGIREILTVIRNLKKSECNIRQRGQNMRPPSAHSHSCYFEAACQYNNEKEDNVENNPRVEQPLRNSQKKRCVESVGTPMPCEESKKLCADLEKCINKWSDGAAFRKNHNSSEKQQNDDNRQ